MEMVLNAQELSTDTILTADELSKSYKSGDLKVEALKNVSLELKRGEMLAVMGSSGSGKSTLLNILGALELPDSGKIYLKGEFIEDYSVEPRATEIRNEHIGFVFQNFSLLNDLTVRENISLPLILNGSKEKDTKKLVSEVIAKVGLESKTNSGILELSGGQQQRVAIARAIVSRPELVLADEPTGNLDYNTSMEIMDLFAELKNELSQSVILVTHDPMVAAYADRVIFLHDGRKLREHVNATGQDNFTEIIGIFKELSAGKEAL